MTMEKYYRRCIIVAGMHRSGTSALTRVINLLGADLPDDLMRGDDHNKLGYWEPKKLFQNHDKALASAGLRWDDFFSVDEQWYKSDPAKQLQLELTEFLELNFSKSKFFVIKDPRICRLIPIWIRALQDFSTEPLFVIPIRNPLEVAHSLKTRDNIPIQKSLLLWLRNVLEAELRSRPYKRSFPSYDFLLKDWVGTSNQIADDLGISWPCRSRNTDAEVFDFLSIGYRNNSIPDDHLVNRSDIVSWVKDTYKTLQDFSNFNEEKLHFFDQIRSDLDKADLAYGSIVCKLSTELKTAVQEKEALVREKDFEVIERKSAIQRRDEAVKERDAAIQERDEAVKERDAAIQERDEAVKERDAAVDELFASNQKHEAEIQVVNNAYMEVEKDFKSLSAAIEIKDEELRSTVSSVSWKATKPIRKFFENKPRFKKITKRTLKFVWWTLTLQIGHKYKDWQQNRQLSKQSSASPNHEQLNPYLNLRDSFLTWHGNSAIYFPPVDNPEISIVIPVYQGIEDLKNCLRSLSVHRSSEPSFEVILVEDCPTDPSVWSIPDSGGLIKVANDKNLGFLLTCNRGAKSARGRFVCFLNSDTIVSAGFLQSLKETFEDMTEAGMVGSMLLNTDGTIQESGWRILQNGWGHPLGRGRDSTDCFYTYRRQVDCVSGACFIVPLNLFLDLGGFDPFLAPAFYEEFDLAFRVREKGFKVVIEPKSRVVHIGSASYGYELRDKLSSLNHAKFVQRFSKVLHKQPLGDEDEFFMLEVSSGPLLLVVDHGIPEPNRHAGDVTMSSYLSLFAAAGWRVVFCPMNGKAEGPPAELLERQGIMLIREPHTLENWIEKYGHYLREALLARPDIAINLVDLIKNNSSARITYYTHDLHHARLEAEAKLFGDVQMRVEAKRVKKTELEIFAKVDCVTSPSEEEAEVIRRLSPDTYSTVIPPYYFEAYDIKSYDSLHFLGLSNIVFVGGFPHTPNVDAALFIVEEIMPIVWNKKPDVKLFLVGYSPPPEVLALAGPNVVVTGQVPDVRPYLEQARIVLSTLRYGAGVKGKTVDALRLGVPVVGTPCGVEGIGIQPGIEAIVEENAEAIARGVLDLLEDPVRCSSLSTAGSDLIHKRYSRRVARRAIENIFSTKRCSVCGSADLTNISDDQNFRESFVCKNCFSLARSEALSRVLIDRIACEGESSLSEIARRRFNFRVHEFGFVGGIADTLRARNWFSVSEFFDNVSLGAVGPFGIRNEDLTQLTFHNESFDYVLSQDVLEHVPDPLKALQEISRILKPGGIHFFTVPQNLNLEKSVTRAKVGINGIEHILQPVYHGDPVRKKGALVFTDFGADLSSILEITGFELIIHEQPVLCGRKNQLVLVFEALKKN